MGWETVRTEPDPRTDTELEAMRDDDIVRRAELWATGATIHDVRGIIGMYRSATGVLDGSKWSASRKEPGMERFALELMVCAIETLARYMSHGDYRKARIDTPLPFSPRTHN